MVLAVDKLRDARSAALRLPATVRRAALSKVAAKTWSTAAIDDPHLAKFWQTVLKAGKERKETRVAVFNGVHALELLLKLYLLHFDQKKTNGYSGLKAVSVSCFCFYTEADRTKVLRWLDDHPIDDE